MSAASRRRAMECAQEREQAVEDASQDRETARCYGIWREPGHGWRTAVIELPRSLVEKYAVEVTEPEIFPIAMGNLETRMTIEAMGLPDTKR